MKRFFLVVFVLAQGCARQHSVPLNPLGFAASTAPPPGQQCELLEEPFTLPSVADLFKSEAAESGSGRSAGAISQPGTYALIEVRFDSSGTRTQAEFLEGTFAPEETQRLLGSLVERVSSSAVHTGQDWGVVIRATESSVGRQIEVNRMEYCACAILNRATFQQLVRAALAERGTFGIPRGQWTVQFDIHTDESGRTLEILMTKSSGIPELDRLVYNLTPQLRIANPLLNRRPLPGWTRVPITFTT